MSTHVLQVMASYGTHNSRTLVRQAYRRSTVEMRFLQDIDLLPILSSTKSVIILRVLTLERFGMKGGARCNYWWD